MPAAPRPSRRAYVTCHGPRRAIPTASEAQPALDSLIMPPKRRASDKLPVRILGWTACLVLAGSLTYTFVRSLAEGPDGVDPLFFGLQAVASFLFLLYSIRLKNRVFIAANAVAVVNAAGTLVVVALG
jgi:lipid-A-disaccharide synthase-like uncharacterized protein